MDQQKEAIKEIEQLISKGIVLKTTTVNLPRKSVEALEIAIEALEKQIPKKVTIPQWASAKCPSCGEELSTHHGDGYFTHPTLLEVCPNVECCQRLDWSDDDDDDD